MHLGGAEHYRPAAERAQLTGVSLQQNKLPTQPAGQVDVSVTKGDGWTPTQEHGIHNDGALRPKYGFKVITSAAGAKGGARGDVVDHHEVCSESTSTRMGPWDTKGTSVHGDTGNETVETSNVDNWGLTGAKLGAPEREPRGGCTKFGAEFFSAPRTNSASATTDQGVGVSIAQDNRTVDGDVEWGQYRPCHRAGTGNRKRGDYELSVHAESVASSSAAGAKGGARGDVVDHHEVYSESTSTRTGLWNTKGTSVHGDTGNESGGDCEPSVFTESVASSWLQRRLARSFVTWRIVAIEMKVQLLLLRGALERIVKAAVIDAFMTWQHATWPPMPCMLPIGLLRSGREVCNEDSDDGAKSEEDTTDSPPLNPRRGPGLAGLIQEIQRVQPRGAAMTAAQSALLLLNLKETDINAHEISKKKCIRVATLAEYIYQTEKVLMDDAAREFGQRGPRFALAASRFLSTFNYNYPFAEQTIVALMIHVAVNGTEKVQRPAQSNAVNNIIRWYFICEDDAAVEGLIASCARGEMMMVTEPTVYEDTPGYARLDPKAGAHYGKHWVELLEAIYHYLSYTAGMDGDVDAAIASWENSHMKEGEEAVDYLTRFQAGYDEINRVITVYKRDEDKRPPMSKRVEVMCGGLTSQLHGAVVDQLRLKKVRPEGMDYDEAVAFILEVERTMKIKYWPRRGGRNHSHRNGSDMDRSQECWDFATKGRCRYGDKCKFKHEQGLSRRRRAEDMEVLKPGEKMDLPPPRPAPTTSFVNHDRSPGMFLCSKHRPAT